MVVSHKSNTDKRLESQMNDTLSNILFKKTPSRPREYRIMVSNSDPVNHSGDAGFYMLANDFSEVHNYTEKIYPASEYTIVQIKIIR